MAGFIVYQKMPQKELLESAEQTIIQIEDWFKANPRRRVCRSELWYGKVHSIKKKNITEQINAIVEDLIVDGMYT